MKIIDETEYKCRCNHCGTRLAFTIEDVYSTYRRGLEMSDGWIDGDCLWHYVTCPKCGKYISVQNMFDKSDLRYLQDRYDKVYDISNW